MYYLRRLLFMAPLLLVISSLAFGLLRLAPGGPFDQERSSASPEVQKILEEKYHLNGSLPAQYLAYLGGLLRGIIGPSTQYRDHTVNDIVAGALPVSLTLGALAFAFALAVGIPLGAYTALRRGQTADFVGSFAAILMFCIPSLVVAPVLIMIFSLKLGWLPPSLWGGAKHAILPMVALGLFYAGRIARLLRESMTEALQAPHITTARAKGVGERRVVFQHAFRLAILPVVSYSGPMLAELLTGSFVVESVFGLPGIGIFVINSVQNRDYFMLVGLTLLYAVLLLLLNLLVDFLYTVLDPRVKYE